MSSFVLDLQKELVSSNCDIVGILRKAHLIASKLSMQDFDKWIMFELNGYANADDVPEYREVQGILKAFNPYQGWIPVILTDAEIEKMICTPKLRNSLSELISLCKNQGTLTVSLPGGIQEHLNEMCDTAIDMNMAVHVSQNAVSDIAEKVKNLVLEWTIRMEAEGIVGENMSFSKDEKSAAQVLPQTINNYYGAANVINGDTQNMQVVAGNEITATFTYEKMKEAVAEIKEAIDKQEMDSENKEEALELLSEINEKVEKKKKPSVIKAALGMLKDFLISAGANVAAGIVNAKMAGLF